MAAFPHQNRQLPFLDTAYITAATINATPAVDLTTTMAAASSSSPSPPRFFHPYYCCSPPTHEPAVGISSNINIAADFGTATTATTVDSGSSLDTAGVLSEKSRTQTAVVVEETKKWKKMNGKPMSSSDLKEGKKRRRRRRKCGRGLEEEEEEEEEEQAPPTDYIHVRARRGQATDSHSLAERARREKIGERMKLLQGLVPGCDKVIGKAIMLDEIINYVQSLQNQVEFLSMKLASVTPSPLYESGLELNEYLAQPHHQIEPTVFVDTPDSFPLVDSSSSPSLPFLLHGQGGPNFFPQEGQGNYEDIQRFLQQQFQLQFNDLCSFQ